LADEVTLQLIYDEVLKVSRRLESLEGVLEELIVGGLPEGRLTPSEEREHDRRLSEMRSGYYVAAEELTGDEV
jgi:hypothetical protein